MEGVLVFDLVVHAAREPEVPDAGRTRRRLRPLAPHLPQRDVVIPDVQVVRVVARGVGGAPPRLQPAKAGLRVRRLGRLEAGEVVHDAAAIA